MLAPFSPSTDPAVAAPVCVRLIGVLDRVLIDAFTDACARLLTAGPRTLIVSMRDVVAIPGEGLRRFAAALTAYRIAGHAIRIDAAPAWNRLLREQRASFAAAARDESRAVRRQIIIAHSGKAAAGSKLGFVAP